MVGVKAVGLEKVGSVLEGTKLPVTLQQLVILLGFLSPQTPFSPSGW
jgi:hypothetical protein